MSIVDEFVTILGLEVDPSSKKEAADFKKNLVDMGKKAAQLGKALNVAATAAQGYALVLANSVDAQGKFSASIGVTFEKLQELGYASVLSGGSVDDMNKDLETLSKIVDTSNPGAYSEALLQLGISARKSNGDIKTATELFGDLAEKFGTMSNKKAQDFGNKLGLSKSTIRLLQSGSDGVKELTDRARELGGVLSEKTAKSAADLDDALFNLRFTVTGVVNTAVSKFFPVLTEMAKKWQNFIDVNRKFIDLGITQVIDGARLGFELFSDAISKAWDFIKSFLPDLDKFSGDLDATKAIAVLVAGGLASMAAQAALIAAPFVAAAIGIAGLVLVMEDIWAYFRGGDSIIGKFVDAFTERFPNISRVVKKAFNSIIDSVKDFFSVYIDSIKDGFKKIMSVFSFVGDMIGKGLDALDEYIGSEDGGAQSKTLSSTQSAPVPAQVIQNSSANTNNNNSFSLTQNISGAGSPMAVAKESVSDFSTLATQVPLVQ